MSSIIFRTILNLTTYAVNMSTASTVVNAIHYYQVPSVINSTRVYDEFITNDNSNQTNSTNTTMDQMIAQYWAYSLLTIPAITLFGNMLVITSVWRFQHLKSPINYFILGLAVADLLVAIVVMPFAVYVEINNGYWEFGPLVCDLYCAADVTCSTASIFLLTIISFDRYVAATHPIKYANSSKGVCQVTLINFVAWFVALCIASPMVLGLNNVEEREETTCRFYNADFIIYSSTGSFCIPLILIIYLYARIWKVIKQRSKFARQRQAKHPASYNVAAETEDPLLVPDKVDSPTIQKNRHSENGLSKLVFSNEKDYFEKYKKTNISRKAALLSPKKFANGGHPTSLQDLRKLTLSEIVLRNNCSLKSICSTESGADGNLAANEQHFRDIDIPYSEMSPVPIAGLSSTFFSFGSKTELSDMDVAASMNTFNDSHLDLIKQTKTDGCCNSVKGIPRLPDTPNSVIKMGFFNNSFLQKSPELFRLKKANTLSIRSANSELSLSNLDSSPESNILDEFAVSETLNSSSWENNLIHAVVIKKKSVHETNSGSNSPNRQLSLKKVMDRKRANRKLSKSARKERKATKTLAIVLGVFLFCWVPFFTLNLLNAVCIKFNWEACQVGFLPFALTTWLGYMNSFMNPIIYTIFNMDFRRAFKQLLCPCLMRQRARRV